MGALRYNKACEFEDFSDPELLPIIRDVFRHEISRFSPEFPDGAEYRKYWEVAMAVRSLRDFGALNPDAVVLGVGAGTEATMYYLSEHVRQVFATDLYMSPGMWNRFAPGFMLVEPEAAAPYPFDIRRLVVQHMDGCYLRYPSDTFDGVFSSSSIEHFGDLRSISSAAYEMGRVLKPGGVVSLSTELCLSGLQNEHGPNLGNIQLFSVPELRKHIAEASGLDFVDVLDTRMSDRTMQSRRALSAYVEDQARQTTGNERYPRTGEIRWSHYPHLVLEDQGHVFTSVHLTLCKASGPWGSNNGWAKPDMQAISARHLVAESEAVRSAVTARRSPLQAVAPQAARERARRLLRWVRGPHRR